MATQPEQQEARPVVVQWSALVDPKQDLTAALRQALGADGLGLVLIAGVPGLQEAREGLLRLAPKLAALPSDVLAQLEDEASLFNFGWSCGKEALRSGQPDVAKGSYYANPVLDDPAQGDEQLMKAFPAYFRPNVWPSQPHQLPELEPAFKRLGALVHGAALRLAVHCDRVVRESLPEGVQPATSIHDVISQSRNHKSRLLHYFPPATMARQRTGSATLPPASPGAHAATSPLLDQQQQQQQPAVEAAAANSHDEAWCGWHTDHGSLTGLTCAMYVDGQGRQVPCPDPAAGLYVRTRRGQVVKVAIPPDHLAFQVGEALQVQSGGVLMATPHYVRAVRGAAADDVSRSNFATFLQPDVNFDLDAPPGVDERAVSVGQWRRGQSFGAFSEATFREYYSDVSGASSASQQTELLAHLTVKQEEQGQHAGEGEKQQREGAPGGEVKGVPGGRSSGDELGVPETPGGEDLRPRISV